MRYLRTGLVHDPKPLPMKDLHAYATARLPAPRVSVTAPAHVELHMAGNTDVGDCTVADGPVNGEAIVKAILGLPYAYPGTPAVLHAYFDLTGGGNTGLTLAQVLKPWSSAAGLLGSKLDGAASVNVGETIALKQTVDFFGYAYCAGNVPQTVETQFKPTGTGMWSVTSTTTLEGHCFGLAGYTSARKLWRGVTWGGYVWIEDTWWLKYGVQAICPLFSDFVAHGGDTRGLDTAQMRADLALL